MVAIEAMVVQAQICVVTIVMAIAWVTGMDGMTGRTTWMMKWSTVAVATVVDVLSDLKRDWGLR